MTLAHFLDLNRVQITSYHTEGGKYNSNESEPWCASFANYSLLKGNSDYPRTSSPASSSFYLKATQMQLEQVDEPYYGSIMVRSNNGKFTGGTGHVAFVVGKEGDAFAQLGGNQAVPGSSEGTTVNVVLREQTNTVRYYHFLFLPKVPLGDSLFEPATKEAETQLGTDR